MNRLMESTLSDHVSSVFLNFKLSVLRCFRSKVWKHVGGSVGLLLLVGGSVVCVEN